ncbi:sulfotransferase, partial [Candidatus Sumerlaeota bacterium]|nr:sulfotransferase [Candidatus Sumerlaeota bacterium]
MEAGRAINLESPVFVVGRPRSGTTLMSAMLDAHRDIAISPGESRIFNHWQVHYSHLDLNKPRDFDIFWSKFTEPDSGFPIFAVEEESLRRRILESSPRNIKTVLDALMSEYAAQFGKCVCGEKTPMHYRHLPLLTEWYPKARIIFTLRDPRAVSASLMKVEWSGKNIYHQTLEWLYFIRTVEQWSGDPRAFSFRYEDLVKDPEDICRKLCAHLQLEYDPNMVKREGMAHRNQNAWRPDMSVHHNQAIQPISMHSLDKWRGDLTRRQIRIIEEYAGEEMRRYGYSPETAGLRGIEKIGLSAEESVRTVLGYVRSRRQEEALISESPIFIMGRPRSGTTLMASMLDAHPEIAILMAETGMFRRWYWRARALNLDSPEDF